MYQNIYHLIVVVQVLIGISIRQQKKLEERMEAYIAHESIGHTPNEFGHAPTHRL